MNALIKTVLVTTLGFGAAFAAFANTPTDSKSTQRTEMMAKMEAQKVALFQQADANKDGKLSATEFAKFNQLQKAAWEARKQEAEKNRFTRLDANKDGALSLDELKAQHSKKGGFKHHKGAANQVQKPAV